MSERRGQRRGEQRVTIAEASDILGISKDAVRMRVKRDTLRWEKEAGRVYVWLDADANAEQNAVHPQPAVEASALVEELRDRVRSLEDMLEREREARTEERRRHDTLMAQLMQRIPELEAPQEREAPETAAEEPEASEPRSATGGASEGAQRPWWRRVFGR